MPRDVNITPMEDTKRFRITLKGTSPYMQHRMNDSVLKEWEKYRGSIIERDGLSDDEMQKALSHAYIDKEGFYIPAEHFKQSLILGGGMVKGKVGASNRTLRIVVSGQWSLDRDKYHVLGTPTIDERSAVNKNNKARVMVYRPKWDEWTAKLVLSVANKNMTDETIVAIIQHAGVYVGIGSYRPQHTGEFGKFKLVKMEEL